VTALRPSHSPRPASRTVALSAPAKLNLALAVGPPDGDGMHPICSWMVTVNLCDELEVTSLPPDRFSRYAIMWHAEAQRRTDIDWSITKDLAVRAHLAIESHVDRRLPVQLKLEKRIPVGGGLGGGSANAAAMLHAINELFELGLTTMTLAEIGATLGSDVPFLVHGGSAIVEGRGESVERHDARPELHVVLVFPEVACPTGPVYREFDDLAGAGANGPAPPGSPRADAVRALVREAGVDPDALFNDLAAAASRVAPELESHLARVSAAAERRAHISGSGSTIFVVCDDALHAEHLARTIETDHGLPAVAAETVAGVIRSSPGYDSVE